MNTTGFSSRERKKLVSEDFFLFCFLKWIILESVSWPESVWGLGGGGGGGHRVAVGPGPPGQKKKKSKHTPTSSS